MRSCEDQDFSWFIMGCVHVSSEGDLWSLGLKGLLTMTQFLHEASNIAKHSHLKFRGERSLFISLSINLSPDRVPSTGPVSGDTVLNTADTGPTPGSVLSAGDTDVPPAASSDAPRNSCSGLKG